VPEQVPQEAVDAAHVQTIAEHDSQSSLFEPTDVAGQAQHAQALREAQTAIADARAPRVEAAVDEGQVATRLGADKLDDAPIVPRGKGLAAADRAIEDRLASKVVDVERTAAEYAQLPDAEGGKVLNTDTARELSPTIWPIARSRPQCTSRRAGHQAAVRAQARRASGAGRAPARVLHGWRHRRGQVVGIAESRRCRT